MNTRLSSQRVAGGRQAFRIASAVSALCVLSGAAFADAVPPEQARIDILLNCVDAFDAAHVVNSQSASAGRDQRSNGVSLPGVFLHPRDAEDAVVSYPNVTIPTAAALGETCLLMFDIGFRDNIPWDGGTANGVRFIVHINGETVFREEFAGVGWQPRAVNLTPWGGQTVTVELRTNAIDANTAYDWCVFGQPVLARVVATERYTELPKGAAGVALARIRCDEPAEITLTMGGLTVSTALSAGTHLIPVSFSTVAELTLTAIKGTAVLEGVTAALHTPKLEYTEMALSSPLVTTGAPFNVVFSVKNSGLGTYLGKETVSLAMTEKDRLAALGKGAGETLPLGVIAPGEARTYIWRGLAAAQPGAYAFTQPCALGFRVFPTSPVSADAHETAATVAINTGAPLRATVSNATSRVSIIADPEGHAYAIADTWNGSAWQRVGSLYPLLSAAAWDTSRAAVPLEFTMAGLEALAPDTLRIDFKATGPNDVAWLGSVTLQPADDAARIHVETQLVPSANADLVSFYGPTLLAGDRAFGAHKDFAIFPGLEYLEGDEESSSERDLAYPLSDRRVPAVYKVAAPLMAAQGEDALVGLLWDATQQWAPKHPHPAARFLAPKYDSGFEYVHMALFAPSVGDFVRENTYGAFDTPYPAQGGQPLDLNAWLVLDHASNYPGDSIVHGPHKGGLVLEAVRHWFDVYGFPAPSEPPRDWEAERALCRDAYANAIWSEDPPGWRHCAGWDAGLLVGQAVPQLLDLRAGVPLDVRLEVERRINLVLDRAVSEQGKHSLWTSAGCHIMLGELPFFYGYLPESMAGFKEQGLQLLSARENGLWVWRPGGEKYAGLGKSGDHTLGQAARNAFVALRAARMTADRDLIAQALEAMRQMDLYEIPRGAQTWECPLYQPDILAAAYAIRAYCEAYRLTGDVSHLDHARYWAWTGLPFLYLWELDGYPTMRYNVISVIGSTFFTHSWIGLPVVWCGEVYAYALQDLAEFDHSFDWDRIATGINRSAMAQQYTEGASKGCYPDSWNMVMNRPNPADINPENILVNGFRLAGPSPEIRCARFQTEDNPIMLNSAADILESRRDPDGTVAFTLKGTPGFAAYTMLAPVMEPQSTEAAGPRVLDSDALRTAASGWLYDAGLKAVVMKHTFAEEAIPCKILW